MSDRELSMSYFFYHPVCTFSDLKEPLLLDAKSDYNYAGLGLTDETGKYGRTIGRAILASPDKRIGVDSPIIQAHYGDFFPSLIRHQVFAYHLGDASVTFESRLSEAYAEDVLLPGTLPALRAF